MTHDFSQLAYGLAARALADGGYNSKTYQKHAFRGHLCGMAGLLTAQSQRMKSLYVAYGIGQSISDWPDFEDEFLRSLAIVGRLQEANPLTGAIRQSTAYWAYWYLHGLPRDGQYPNEPLLFHWSEEEIETAPRNHALFNYVFEGLRGHYLSGP